MRNGYTLFKKNVNFVLMNFQISTYQRIILRKVSTILLISCTAIGSFAALGDGKMKKTEKEKHLLSFKNTGNSLNGFSLKSGYQYRGSQILTEQNEDNFFMINTNITYQKGNATYIMPLKKKVLLEKVKFSINQYNDRY